MDGFAVHAADVAGTDPWVLPVGGDIPAGAPRIDCPPGHAVRVMTGAPVPPGADILVVPVEQTDASAGPFRAARADHGTHRGCRAQPYSPGWGQTLAGADCAVVVNAEGFDEPLCALWRQASLLTAIAQTGARDVPAGALLRAAGQVVRVPGTGAERDFDTPEPLAELGDVTLGGGTSSWATSSWVAGPR